MTEGPTIPISGVKELYALLRYGLEVGVEFVVGGKRLEVCVTRKGRTSGRFCGAGKTTKSWRG